MSLFLLAAFVASVMLTMASVAQAAPPASPNAIPGPADVGRVQSSVPQSPPVEENEKNVSVPSGEASLPAPAAAKSIHFVLRAVDIAGGTVFSQKDWRTLYASDLGKTVSLDIAWQIAGSITERYHNAGYFLSRAYVPRQQVRDGRIVIKVVEGYIGQIKLEDKQASNHVVKQLAQELMAERPVTAAQLESFLLRLDDLPGYSYRSVLAPLSQGEGAVLLSLVPVIKDGQGAVSLDNYGSRFLGPEELTGTYSVNILPLQQTNLTLFSSIPTKDVKDAALTHTITLTPKLALALSGSYTQAYPGYTLKPFDIDSRSATLGAQLTYQAIRQRDHNLSFTADFDGRNTHSDLLSTPQVRDRSRAVRLGAVFDNQDRWQGHNSVNVSASRGLSIFNGSDEGDPNLSRVGAGPDFTKLNFDASRTQTISASWSALVSASGQYAPRPLFSSEQFGYGGQAYGRAFDNSELLGDSGLDGAAELRYDALDTGPNLHVTPYGFYDIGTVWLDGDGFEGRTSGASAGFGLRLAAKFNLAGNIGLAFPLTRQIATPIYGGSGNNPRLLAQVTWNFDGPSVPSLEKFARAWH